MKDANGFVEDFEGDVPRGLRSRPLKEQSIPQAGWQETPAILKSQALAYDPDDPGRKVLIGALGEKLIGIDENRHTLTVAGSRAGKSVTIINNLLFYRGSVLCTDPKAELASITAQRRADLGQKVFILDPFERCAPEVAQYRASYNPLSRLDVNAPTVIEDAGLIADALILTTGQEKDRHWDDSARNFIEGLILLVATDPLFEGRRNLITVRELLTMALKLQPGVTDENDKPLCTVQDQMLDNAVRIMELTGNADLAGAIEGAAREFYDKADTERAGVLSTARRHTRLLDYTSMRSVLRDGERPLDLADLKRDPEGVSVFLCLPAGRMGTCSRWLRIFINQLLDAAERERTVPEVPVLVCLDEFPVLGFMSQLQDAAGQVASFHLRLWVIIQDWGQGKALYGERWESFAANAGILQAFGNADVTTTEYLSRTLGKTPVEVTREGEVEHEKADHGVSGRSQVRELHDLLAPEEITRLFSRDDRLKRQLVIWTGYRPMILQRVEYYDEASTLHRWFAGKFGRTA